MAQLRMPQTQSSKLSCADEISQQVPDDTSASFNGQLDQFCFNQGQNLPGKRSSSPQSSRTSVKRTRTVATTTIITTTGCTTTSPEPREKKRRKPSKYAHPSQYAHLKPLVDILEPNLICVFVGTNPGIGTAIAGHAYAHPSNLFWKLLHTSGLTDRRLRPEEDRTLPARYAMGNTNIVARPSKDAAELSKEELAAGTLPLDEKLFTYQPEAVCIVGKGIWEAIWRYRYGTSMKKGEFTYGWQDERHNMGKYPYPNPAGVAADKAAHGEARNGGAWQGARVYVATSTSGLAASLKPAEKEEIWRPFGQWVQQRRKERGFVPQSK